MYTHGQRPYCVPLMDTKYLKLVFKKKEKKKEDIDYKGCDWERGREMYDVKTAAVVGSPGILIVV